MYTFAFERSLRIYSFPLSRDSGKIGLFLETREKPPHYSIQNVIERAARRPRKLPKSVCSFERHFPHVTQSSDTVFEHRI